MSNQYHDEMTLLDLHSVIVKEYPYEADRLADTEWNTALVNENKMVFVHNVGVAPAKAYILLESIDVEEKYKWFEFGNAIGTSLASVLAIGNTSDGNDIIMTNNSGIVIGSGSPIGSPVYVRESHAAIDLQRTDQGILLNRLTTIQRDALSMGSPHDGLLIYNTDTKELQFYNKTEWSGVPDGLPAVLTLDNTTSGSNLIISSGDALISNEGISVGGSPAVAGASIDLQRNDQALIFNRLTTTERDALTFIEGMKIYNITTHQMEYYNGTTWVGASEHDAYIELTDTISAFDGAGRVQQINTANDGLESGQALRTTDNVTFNDMVLTGDLDVQGTRTFIDTATLLVEDKNIELGVVGSPTDITADGGGITLKGATDKLIAWYNATNAWTFNQISIFEEGMTIGTNAAPPADILLDLKAARALGLPELTTIERDALGTPSRNGIMIWNTTSVRTEVWNGTAWIDLHAGSGDITMTPSVIDYQVIVADGASGNLVKGATGARIFPDGFLQITNTTSDTFLAEFVDSVGNGIMFAGWSSGVNIDPTVANSNIYFGRDKAIESVIFETGNILVKSGLGNNFIRPVVGTARIDGEIGGIGENLGSDDGFIRLSAGGGTNATTKSYIDLSGYSLVGDTALNIVFGTGGAERVRIDYHGYVGIGTKTPPHLLSVVANAVGEARISVNETGLGGNTNPGYELYSKDVFKGGIFYSETTDTVEIFNDAGGQLFINDLGLGVGGIPVVQFDVYHATTAVQRLNSVSGTQLQFLAGSSGTVISSDSFIAFCGSSDNNTSAPSNEVARITDNRIHSWSHISVGLTIETMGNASIRLDDDEHSLLLNNVFTTTRDGYSLPESGMLHLNVDYYTPEYYNGRRAKWECLKSQNIVYVNSVNDLPTPIEGLIELDNYTTYVGNDGLTSVTVTDNIAFGLNSRMTNMVMQTSGTINAYGNWELRNCSITYTGTGNILDIVSMVGIGQIGFTTFYFTAAGTLFNIGSVASTRILVIDNMGAVNAGGAFSMGQIRDVEVKLGGLRGYGFANGLECNDNDRLLLTDIISIGTNASTTHLTINGTNQNSIQIKGLTPTVQSNEYALFFDPATNYNGVVTISSCTVDDADRAFAPTSLDQTQVGFKFLGNANIPDSTASLLMWAPTSGTQLTTLIQTKAKRINAVYEASTSERFAFTAEGNMEYLGNERLSCTLASTITGSVDSGTNINCNFFYAHNKNGMTITTIIDLGGDYDRITTSQPHELITGDRIIIEGTTNGYYDGEYTVTVVSTTEFDIYLGKQWNGNSWGMPSKLIKNSTAPNTFSSTANKSTSINTLLSMGQNDIIFLCVENLDNAADWSHNNIQAVLHKV